MSKLKTGTIVQISGPVVDVEFQAGHLPKMKEALTVERDGVERVMEVAQHVGDEHRALHHARRAATVSPAA